MGTPISHRGGKMEYILVGLLFSLFKKRVLGCYLFTLIVKERESLLFSHQAPIPLAHAYSGNIALYTRIIQ